MFRLDMERRRKAKRTKRSFQWMVWVYRAILIASVVWNITEFMTEGYWWSLLFIPFAAGMWWLTIGFMRDVKQTYKIEIEVIEMDEKRQSDKLASLGRRKSANGIVSSAGGFISSYPMSGYARSVAAATPRDIPPSYQLPGPKREEPHEGE